MIDGLICTICRRGGVFAILSIDIPSGAVRYPVCAVPECATEVCARAADNLLRAGQKYAYAHPELYATPPTATFRGVNPDGVIDTTATEAHVLDFPPRLSDSPHE